jgi:hypothetical protein
MKHRIKRILTQKELDDMMQEAYASGYAHGMADAIVENAPTFDKAEEKHANKAVFSEGGTTYRYRSTVL